MWKFRACFYTSLIGLATMLLIILLPVTDPVTTVKALALACLAVAFSQIVKQSETIKLIADILLDMGKRIEKNDQDHDT